MKHRMFCSGSSHTIGRPALLGPVITASSGTSVHTPLTGTQYRDSRMSYSVSCPSASEQQKPLALLSESNHCLSGLLAYRPSSRAIVAVVSRSKTNSAERMCDFPFNRPASRQLMPPGCRFQGGNLIWRRTSPAHRFIISVASRKVPAHSGSQDLIRKGSDAG